METQVSSNASPDQEEEKKNFRDANIIFKDDQITEYDEYVVIGGNKLKKPFLEKPINAEDHEVFIHYSGAGYSVLFRKTENNCSQFFKTDGTSAIRTEGSYVYEEFLPTDSFDIKVYTVGEDYAHAEARKCPSLDGKVARNKTTGKEVRYPVNLTSWEKEIARRVSLEFKQGICGFDMLRSGGKTYVCDVNGFSFVKSSDNYYVDCAYKIKRMIFDAMGIKFHRPTALSQNDDGKSQISSQRPFRPAHRVMGPRWELRSVVAVFRHGDRTPKQKMKMITSNEKFL